jgi:hypothetical protein
MIPDRHPDDLAGSDQPAGEIEIVSTRLELTARVVVIDQHPRRTVSEGPSEEIRRIDGRLGSGSDAVFVASDQAVPAINGEKAEDLASLHLHPPDQILTDNCRIAENLGLAQPRPSDSVTEFETREDGRGLGRTDTADAEQFRGTPPSQLGQSSRFHQQGVGLDDRSPSASPGAHENGQELCVRKNGRAEFEQAFARP